MFHVPADRRTVPMTFSMMFVQESGRRCSGDWPSFVR
jgi:hypothetical protein